MYVSSGIANLKNSHSSKSLSHLCLGAALGLASFLFLAHTIILAVLAILAILVIMVTTAAATATTISPIVLADLILLLLLFGSKVMRV